LPLYWYRLSGRLLYDPYLAVYPYDRPGFGAEVGNGGYTFGDAWFNLRFNVKRLATGFLGWPWVINMVFPVVPFIAAAVLAVLRRLPALTSPLNPSPQGEISKPPPRACHLTWDLLLLGAFASLVALYVTYWFYGGHDGGFPRYWLAALPALLLLTARGVDITACSLRRLGERLTHGPLARLPVAALYLALIGLVAYDAFIFLPPELTAFRGRYGVTTAPLQVVREAGIRHAVVFVDGVEHWYDFAVFFAANSPTLDSDVVYAIYHNPKQAGAVRALYADRACYLQRADHLEPCPFD
jgi:hypothetical protein